jgi:hypothetical protein
MQIASERRTSDSDLATFGWPLFEGAKAVCLKPVGAVHQRKEPVRAISRRINSW